MALKKYTYRKDGDEWVLKGRGDDRALRRFDTKVEGMDFIQDMKIPRSVTIFDSRDNKIQEERTYPRSLDSFPPRG